MREIIKKGHDYRIIPQNFESATIFEVKNINENDFEIVLTKVKPEELKDYQKNSTVEIFGSGDDGLIFFETKILENDNENLKIAIRESPLSASSIAALSRKAVSNGVSLADIPMNPSL